MEAPPQAQAPKLVLSIILDEKGIHVDGPIHDEIFCRGILSKGLDILTEHWKKQEKSNLVVSPNIKGLTRVQ